MIISRLPLCHNNDTVCFPANASSVMRHDDRSVRVDVPHSQHALSPARPDGRADEMSGMCTERSTAQEGSAARRLAPAQGSAAREGDARRHSSPFRTVRTTQSLPRSTYSLL